MDESKSDTLTATGASSERNSRLNASSENGATAAQQALLANCTDVNYRDKSRVPYRQRLFRSGPARLMVTAIGIATAVTALLVAFFVGKWSAVDACGNGDVSTLTNHTRPLSDIALTSSIQRTFPTVWPPTVAGTPIVRLSNHVVPLHYDLFTDMRHLHERRYTGSVVIRLQCNNDTDNFTIHAGNEISLDTVELFQIDPAVNGKVGKRDKISNVKWIKHEKLPLLTIQIFVNNGASRMNRNALYSLKIEFSATVCGERSGFVCGNGNGNGNNEIIDGPEKMFVATKFEPNFARTAFPCFDEPHFKATFNWSVVRTREMTVLTNTPSLKKTRQGKGDVLEQFEQTPPMSVYLFAILVAPLVSQEARTDRGVRISVWTKPEDKKRARFALTYSVHVFNSVENYFMINYPLTKLDLVALDYYPVGGMENWGLIMFHNQMLLHSDEAPTDGKRLASKFKVAHIIAHELLHQWFGNLVTMSWWSDLWLNEGFAMFYLHYFIKNDFDQLSEFHSFWKLSQTWTRQTQLPDSNERPSLVRNFINEESIADAFDEWNLYAKGSAMVKLLWDLLGENSLRGGLINYLKNNAYKSVALEDLWENLRPQYRGDDKTSLGVIMNKWLTNPGFPELHVTRDYNRGDIRVEQRLADLENNLVYWNSTKINGNFTWSIPVAYIVQENLVSNEPTGIPFWLHNKSDIFSDHTLTSNQWLLVNPHFQFPYRINYDLLNWELLIKQLLKNHQSISVKSRMQLILDASFFLRETDNVRIFIELLSYLKRETEPMPMFMGLQELFALFDAYKATSLYPYLVVYFRPVIVQMTNVREEAKNDPELDAVWNLDQSFDLTLKLLQCITNNQKCHIEKEEVQGFLTLPLSTDSGKLAMVCQYLYRKAEAGDKVELFRWLEQTGSRRGDIVLLAACVRDRKLNRRTVGILIEKNNAKLLGSAVAGAFSLSYNAIVHQEIWTQLSALSGDRLIDLFKDNPVLQRMMLRHVGSLSELTLARKAFGVFTSDLNYVEAVLEWRQQIVPQLEEWLMEELNIL